MEKMEISNYPTDYWAARITDNTYACRNVRCLTVAIQRYPIDQLEQSGDDVPECEDTSVDELLWKDN